jgi:hypothetical protein
MESVKDAVQKELKNTNISSELSPGSTGRRYEPQSGLKRHNERIHRESKFADDNMNLPFSFSKPKNPQRRKTVKCTNCGNIKSVNKNTIGVVCNSCNVYSSVEEVNING